MLFEDRRDAGRLLAQAVGALQKDAVVLALPRGGMPVAYEVARAHNLPLDILVVRKLGVPGHEELAMGAIASGGTLVLNPDILQEFKISSQTLLAVTEQEELEIERREHAYRGGYPPIEKAGRVAILVDDGLATGATMRAAARAVRPRAKKVVIAVPVAARSICEELENEADHVICARVLESIGAVGEFYRNFQPTSDNEVRALLIEAYNIRRSQTSQRS
jgi:predicted phosphoribosyltransferase